MWTNFFFFQAEDGIRDVAVTGVQTCALPICDREHLLLAAGERARELAPPVAQHGEELERVLESRRQVAPGNRMATDEQILEHGELDEDVAPLRHVPDTGRDDPVRGLTRDVAPLVEHAAVRGPHQSRNRSQRRGLATAVRPEERDDLAAAHRERDALHRAALAVEHREVLDRERRRHPHRLASHGGADLYPSPRALGPQPPVGPAARPAAPRRAAARTALLPPPRRPARPPPP